MAKADNVLRKCWAVKVLGILMKLREVPPLDSVSIPDLCRWMIDVDRVGGSLQYQVLQCLVLDHTDPCTCTRSSTWSKHQAYVQWLLTKVLTDLIKV